MSWSWGHGLTISAMRDACLSTGQEQKPCQAPAMHALGWAGYGDAVARTAARDIRMPPTLRHSPWSRASLNLRGLYHGETPCMMGCFVPTLDLVYEGGLTIA